MSSYNKWVGIGNLVRDPELRYVGVAGTPVVKMTLAINGRKNHPEDTTFIDVVAWEKQALSVNEYLKKGDSALVEGALRIRSYFNKEGEKRYATEIVAANVKFLSTRRTEAAPASASASAQTNEFAEEMEESIPF